MKKFIITFIATILASNVAYGAYSQCYTSYQGQTCAQVGGVDYYVMQGLNCAPETDPGDPNASSLTSWDAYCDALPHGSGVNCLATEFDDAWNAAYCACDTGYAGAACDSCASGYVDLGGGTCIKETALIYDADKDTIVTVEESADEDDIHFYVAGDEKGLWDGDVFHAYQANGEVMLNQAAEHFINVRPDSGNDGYITFTEDTVHDRWAIGIDAGDSKLHFRAETSAGDDIVTIDEDAQVAFKTWGDISTTDYGAFGITTAALDGEDNVAIMLGAENGFSDGKVLGVYDSLTGMPDTLFTIDGEGQLELASYANIMTSDYGRFFVSSNAIPSDNTSPVFGLIAQERLNDDYIIFTVGHDYGDTPETSFQIDAIGQQTIGSWAEVLTNDYGGYTITSQAANGGTTQAFMMVAMNNLTTAPYLFMMGDDGSTSFDPVMGVTPSGQIQLPDGGSSYPAYSFFDNPDVGMYYYEIDDEVAIGMYGYQEFAVAHNYFEGETFQSKSGPARIQGAWTDGINARALSVGNKYLITNSDARLIEVYDGPIMGIGPSSFAGTGNRDMFIKGTFTGSALTEYVVEIDGEDPDTFRWSDDNGATWDASTVAITGSWQTLNNGVQIIFRGDDDGHVSGDKWEFDGIPQTIRSWMNIAGGWMMGVEADWDDFENTMSVVSLIDSGITSSANMGMVFEAGANLTNEAYGAMGIGRTSSANGGVGLYGIGIVDDTSDTPFAVGVMGSSTETHAGGDNVGVYGIATGGDNNYSFYGLSGDLYNTGSIQGADYYSGDGTQGVTTTISVRKGDDSGACTITVKDGLITGDDC